MCIRKDNKDKLEYVCSDKSLQALQDFKWLTNEDAVSCKKQKKTDDKPTVEVEGSNGLTLNLVHIAFPSKALTNEWLKSPCYVTVLKVSHSNLETIESNAFNTEIFSNLIELKLRYADIRLLKSGAFNGLTDLRRLTLDSISLDIVSRDVLVPCPKLNEFHIYFSFDTAHPVQNKWFSGDALLNELEVVDLFGNEIRKGIDNTTFNAAGNIKILSLRDNYIETIGKDAFSPIKSLKFLDLTNNYLKTMPSELKNLMERKPDIHFELGNNPWECTCELETVRKYYLRRESSPFPIVCDGGMRIEKCMDLCSEDSNCHDLKATPESLLPFWHQLSPTEQKISVKCKASTVSIVLQRPSARFLIGQYLDGDYFINLNGFTSERIVVVSEVGIYANTENSTCITNNRNVNMQFTIRLRPNSSYLFCFLDKVTLFIRPFNCFAFHSKREEINTSNNIWILNEDRNIIIFLCIVSGIISISLGTALAFIGTKLRTWFPTNDDETQINQSCYIENGPLVSNTK